MSSPIHQLLAQTDGNLAEMLSMIEEMKKELAQVELSDQILERLRGEPDMTTTQDIEFMRNQLLELEEGYPNVVELHTENRNDIGY